MAVLDNVGMFGAVKHGDWSLVALGSYVGVCGVDGDRHEVDKQMTCKHNASTLTHTVKEQERKALDV